VFVKFSKPAERDGNTLNGRPVRVGTTGVPIFEEAIAWIECRVVQSHDMGTHTLFVGEIVDAGVNDDETRAAAISDTRMKYGGVKRRRATGSYRPGDGGIGPRKGRAGHRRQPRHRPGHGIGVGPQRSGGSHHHVPQTRRTSRVPGTSWWRPASPKT
jgi:hypothetical protein